MDDCFFDFEKEIMFGVLAAVVKWVGNEKDRSIKTTQKNALGHLASEPLIDWASAIDG